ncbi:MAG: PAS domain S-box protein, partial [Candidatus Latescibacterota bacterium]
MSDDHATPDYRAVFDALPLPATLLDRDGIIVDLNGASVALAHRVGRQITKADRIGRPFASFAVSEDHRPRLAALVQQALQQGQAEDSRWEFVTASGERFWTAFHAATVRDSDGQPTGVVVLRPDITERVRQERFRDSQERLRDELWRMSDPQELAGLLQVLHRELTELLPLTAASSVQLRDPDTRQWISYHLDRSGAQVMKVYPRPHGAVMTCWQSQRPVYRADLTTEDPFAEAGALWSDEYGYSAAVRAVLDVPFAQGTLAVNSHHPHAFSETDVRILHDLGQVLAVGLARMADLQRLSQRTRELEQEVVQRQQAEEALRQSEQRYRRLLETPRDLVVLHLDPDGRYHYVGPQIEEWTGMPSSAFYTDRSIGGELTHPEDVGATVAAFRAAVQTGTVQEVEFRYRHADGSWHWARETLTPVPGPGGALESVQAVLQDTTARRQVEERLQLDLSLQRLRLQTMEMSDEAGWGAVVARFQEEVARWMPADASSINVLHLDRQCFTSYGLALDPRPDGTEEVTPEPGIWEALVRTMQSGPPLCRRSRRDPLFSRRLPAEVNSIVDVGFLGGTVGVHSTGEDAFSPQQVQILERFAEVISQGYRRLEDLRALREAEERFRQAQKMEAIGQLAGGVAHDFNNLLTIVIGQTQLARQKTEHSPELREALEDIERAGSRGARLVEQLLAFSRRQALRPERLDLNAAVADSAKMLRQLLGDEVELVTVLGEEPIGVEADRGQLTLLMLNLAVNA